MDQLQLLISCFLRPLKMAASSQKPPCNHDEVNSIFLNGETIMFLHQIFLKGLTARMENWPTLVLGTTLVSYSIVSSLFWCAQYSTRTCSLVVAVVTYLWLHLTLHYTPHLSPLTSHPTTQTLLSYYLSCPPCPFANLSSSCPFFLFLVFLLSNCVNCRQRE